MADLRIFSYLPNPRLYKATIAARFSGATVEIVGAKPMEMPTWLWDYDARHLDESERVPTSPYARQAKTGFAGTLYKTDAFLAANPYGDIPAAFGPGGDVGIFESNSIMRAAARLGDQAPHLYGGGPLQLSRIDGFLDRALVFARDLQHYLLAGPEGMTETLHGKFRGEIHAFLSGAEQALQTSPYLAGEHLTLADIVLFCEVCQLSGEVKMGKILQPKGLEPLLPLIHDYPAVMKHLAELSKDPRFAEDLGDYYERLDLAA